MNTALELQKLIDEYLPQLNTVSEEDFLYKPSPKKWSKKELIGHLIDSAENNIRRFIVTQYEENTTIMYKQDEWVAINNYQGNYTKDIIQLWYLLNKQVSNILKKVTEETAQRTCLNPDANTIEWFAHDYVKHLKHHMHQVLNLEPVAYP